MSARWTRLSALFGAVTLCTGCYTTSVRSGAAPGRTPVGYEDRWHHGFLWGLAEASGPYDINQICPQGWSEVRTELTFLTGLVGALTWGIYYPQSVTFVCGAGPAPMGPFPALPATPPTSQPVPGSPGSTPSTPEIGGAPPPAPSGAAPSGSAAPTPPAGASAPPGGSY
jgi:hypothetical protein